MMKNPFRASATTTAKVKGRICLAAILAVLTLTAVFMAAQATLAAPAAVQSPLRLHQYKAGSPIKYTQYLTGEKTKMDQPGINKDLAPAQGDCAFWHFVDPNKGGGYAVFTFWDPARQREVESAPVYSFKNGQHFGIITRDDWLLVDAWYYTNSPKLFNISHTEKTSMGKVVG